MRGIYCLPYGSMIPPNFPFAYLPHSFQSYSKYWYELDRQNFRTAKIIDLIHVNNKQTVSSSKNSISLVLPPKVQISSPQFTVHVIKMCNFTLTFVK